MNGTPSGAQRTRAIEGKPIEERKNSKALGMVGGIPRRLSDKDPAMDEEVLKMHLLREVELGVAVEEAVWQVVPERMYNKRAYSQNFGYTEMCPGCRSVVTRGTQQNHARRAERGSERVGQGGSPTHRQLGEYQ